MFYTIRRFGSISTFWNPLDQLNSTLSFSNLRADLTDASATLTPNAALDTFWSTGKKYFEIEIETLPTSPGVTPVITFGLRHVYDGLSRNASATAVGARINYQPSTNQFTPQLFWASSSGGALIGAAGGDATTFPVADTTGEHGLVQGDQAMIALDFDNQKGWLGRNGTWMNGGDPAAGTGWQWDWADVQALQSAFRWRFFFRADGPFDTNPVRFNLATGNRFFPQRFLAPTGFAKYHPPAVADFYGGFNLRQSSINNGSSQAWQHPGPNWADNLWFNGATLFIGLTAFGMSQALLFPGGKYYVEMQQAIATGTSVQAGIVNSSLSPTTGVFSSVEFCAWRGDGALTAFAGITVDSTGTVSYLTTDLLGIAVDLVNGKAWLRKNGTFVNSGDPAAGTNPQFSDIPTDKVYSFLCAIVSASRQWAIYSDPSTITGSLPTGFVVPKLIETYAP